MGVYIGARDEAAARKLWESLPPVYRQFLGSVWSRSTPAVRQQNQLPKSDSTIH
ncbi:hypothetical protein NDI43_01185 [Microcoleus vaginatus GB2-A3]